MPYAGLTGCFGAGKSTVREIFEKLGATGIDADALVRNLVDADAAIRREIAARIGPEVLRPDGTLDRPKTAEIVFSDDLKRADLEALLHPYVFAEAERIRDKAYAKDPSALVIFEAPLLVETGYYRRMDALVTVICPMDILLQRLKTRGFSAESALKRLRAQLSQEEKSQAADFVVNNGGTIADTASLVTQIKSRLSRL